MRSTTRTTVYGAVVLLLGAAIVGGIVLLPFEPDDYEGPDQNF